VCMLGGRDAHLASVMLGGISLVIDTDISEPVRGEADGRTMQLLEPDAHSLAHSLILLNEKRESTRKNSPLPFHPVAHHSHPLRPPPRDFSKPRQRKEEVLVAV